MGFGEDKMDKLPVIPGYRIIKKLGKGGMARVYLGVQENLGREVAIKVMIPALFMDEAFAERFEKEARIAARLVHPNIITIHDVGRNGDFYYIVMEHLEESLNNRMKQRGGLTPKESLEIVKNIAGALEYAHKKGIIHRDIKPDNIMFRFDNTPILVDFGIAKAMDSSTKLTKSGTNIGTPYYMSTEQCKGEKVDGRSDIYSLGVVLYEMFTGSVPYKAESAAGIILQHIQKPVPTLPAHLSQFQPLIDKMMTKQRENRVQTGKELRMLIDSIVNSEFFAEPSPGTTPIQLEVTVPSPPPFPSPDSSILRQTKKKWFWTTATTALLVVLTTLGIYVMTQSTQKSIEPGDHPVNNSRYGKIPEEKKEPNKTAEVFKKTNTEKLATLKRKPKETIEKKVKPTIVEPPGKEKKQQTVEKKAAETSYLKTVKLTRLPPGLIAQYKEKIKKIYVRDLPGDVKAMGQITLSLTVDGKGNPRIRNFEDIELIVIPAGEKDTVKNLISKKIKSISFEPPKDKQGFPVNLEKWRLTFKVAYFGKKIILTRL